MYWLTEGAVSGEAISDSKTWGTLSSKDVLDCHCCMSWSGKPCLVPSPLHLTHGKKKKKRKGLDNGAHTNKLFLQSLWAWLFLTAVCLHLMINVMAALLCFGPWRYSCLLGIDCMKTKNTRFYTATYCSVYILCIFRFFSF